MRLLSDPAVGVQGSCGNEGMHLGDLPNLHVPEDGRLRVDLFAWRVGFSELLDGDGSALVIHAAADDYETDPAGDAGDRIACGVIGRTLATSR